MGDERVTWSDEMYRINGLEPQSELITIQRTNSFVHPNDADRFLTLKQTSFQQPGFYQLEHRIVLDDGTVKWVMQRFESLASEKGNILRVHGTLQNITERKEAEQELLRIKTELAQRTTDKYLTLFNSIDKGFCVFDMVFDKSGKLVDCIVAETNPAWERVTGITGAAGKSAKQMMPGAEDYWYETFGHVALTGEAERLENYLKPVDRWFDVYISRVGDKESRRVAIIFSDITERKQREANLAFLAEVSQYLVGLTSIGQTMTALGEKIGVYFGASHCAFFEFNEEMDGGTCAYDWRKEGERSLIGTYRLSDFYHEELLQTLRAGKPFIVRDRDTDSRVNAENLARLNIGAYIVIPIASEKQLRFALTVYDSVARDWQAAEVDLMGEITTRIWTRLEKAKAEEALRQSEESYRIQLEADIRQRTEELQKNITLLQQAEALAAIGSWEYDISTGRFNWSEGMYRMFELQTGTAVAPDIYIQLAVAKDKPVAVEIVNKIKTGSGTVDETLCIQIGKELRIIKIKGNMMPNEKGIPVKVVGVDMDVTLSRQSEQILEQQAHFIQSTNVALPDILFVMDLNTKTFTYINHSFEEKLGYPATQTADRKVALFDIMQEDDRPLMVAHIERMKTAADGEIREIEYRLVAPDGSLRWFNDRDVVFRRDKAGVPMEKIGIAQDITSRKKTEQDLKDSNTSLRYANENLQQFASIASHDLQEPLRKLKLFVSVLKRFSQNLPAEGKELIGKISLTSERMSQLIREVLQYSKIANGSKEFVPTNLHAVLRNVLVDVELLIHESGAHIEYTQPLPQIDANPPQINQLFYNLLVNALKFRKEGVPPVISISYATPSPNQHENFPQLKEGDAYLEIVFADNGIGFKQQYAEQIFQIFERLHSVDDFEGTGVGLALCKKIVENHHGHIYATSSEGAGASFHILLPVVQ